MRLAILTLCHNCLSMQDLVADLKSELSGDFEKVMVGLMMTTVEYDAHELKSAIKVSTVGKSCSFAESVTPSLVNCAIRLFMHMFALNMF